MARDNAQGTKQKHSTISRTVLQEYLRKEVFENGEPSGFLYGRLGLFVTNRPCYKLHAAPFFAEVVADGAFAVLKAVSQKIGLREEIQKIVC